MPTTTPYATAMPYVVSAAPGWLKSDYDENRLDSYDLYDDMYNNSPSTYALMLRGSDEKPIYIPTAKRIINTLARYVGKNWGYAVLTGQTDDNGEPIPVDPQVHAQALDALDSLFKRERILSQFATGKKDFLARGDWVWMILGDDTKAPGRKISVKTIDPRSYFPLQNDPEDLDRVTGCQIIDEILDVDGEKVVLRVQTYLKPSDPDYDPEWGDEIAYEVAIWDQGEYSKADGKPERYTTPIAPLAGITAMPVYHIRNNETAGDPFGRSDLSGLESLVAGINQSVSDEDLALAMQGLGMYWTDSGAPKDETTGLATNWVLGPERVVEVSSGTSFNKVQGITSVEPSQTHIAYLEDQAYAVNGLSDVAMGTADTAESGVALALRLQPLFDAADDKDLSIKDSMDQLMFDLTTIWFPLYEGVSFDGLSVVTKTDHEGRVPFDRASAFNELLTLFTDGIVTLSYVQRILAEKFGYEFTADDLQEAVAAKQAADQAAADATVAARSAAELADASGTPDTSA